MDQIYAWALAFRLWLAEIGGPLAPVQALAGLTFLTIVATRKWAPTLWLFLETVGPEDKRASRVFLALPSLIVSTGLAALAAGDDPWVAVVGVLVGTVLPLAHHAFKSYTGNLGAEEPPPRKPLSALLVVAVLLVGCGEPPKPPKPPKYTPEEIECMALAAGRTELLERACGENVEGACSSDSLIDAEEREVEACFSKK